MLVYLDSKDLINLLESSNPVGSRDFGDELRRREWELVLSFCTVAELAAPLLSSPVRTNVMALLNSLEELPITYIADASILREELKEAVSAFSEKRDYQPIRPFVKRFDETIPMEGPPASRVFLRFGLAETMFMLWTENPAVLRGFDRHSERYKGVVEQDRALAPRPSLRAHFSSVLERNLQLFGISLPASSVSALTDWIVSEPIRCPGNRLVFEMFHAISKNRTDKLYPSDLADFNHLYCLPYVDLATVDRRIYGYLMSLRPSTGPSLQTKCYRSLRAPSYT
jgi:hypothetical protein